MHFWQVVTRWRGGSCSPVKNGFIGAMPELMSRSDGSFCGMSEKARQAEMTLGFKETEVHLAQLVESSVLHIN